MLLLGDCNDWLKEIQDNSIDLLVTDPPYGIEFMGKDWDRALVPTETWKECYRVLKEGKLAFVMCSPRQDVLARMIVNLQDAGFRTNYTSIYWTFASGFPKAANVSKLIDKKNGRTENEYKRLGDYLKNQRQKLNISTKEITQLFPSKTGGLTGCLWNWEHAENVPTLDQWTVLKNKLDLDNRFDELIEREEAEREIIGKNKTHGYVGDSNWNKTNVGYKADYNITKPATEEAKKMEGAYVGFQPKPALEIILQCQKPFSPECEITIIISECLSWIQCISVNIAENNSSLLQTVRDFIAQNIAMEEIVKEATVNIGKVGDSFVPMDILMSILGELMEKQNTNWNTVLLWKIILAGALAKVNKLTTETINEMIIELRTLNLLLSQSIQNNTTTQEKTFQNGNRLNVSIVENILANVLIRLVSTKNTSVLSNVSPTENVKSNVKPAGKSSKSNQSITSANGNTAQTNATTKREVKVILVVSKGKTLTWLDDCRTPYQSDDDKESAKPGSLVPLTYRNYCERHGYDRIVKKPDLPNPVNEKGRFPANLLVSDDVLNNGKITKSSSNLDRFKGVNVFNRGKYGQDEYSKNMVVNSTVTGNDEGSYSRYFSLDSWAEKTLPFLICPKASKAERNKGVETLEPIKVNDGRNTPIDNPFQRGETLRTNSHPTVKPLKLMSYLITMGSREGDLVLDPFCGSGTVLIAADQLHRKWIGIEKNPEYAEIIKRRLMVPLSQLKLTVFE